MLTLRLSAVFVTTLFASSVYAAAQQCDAVVIGAGGAGMRTAIVLKEAGKNVCLIEKMPFVGGSANLAATYFTVINTKEQKAAGYSMNIDEFIAKQQKAEPNLSKERYLELHENDQEPLDWLNALGADITRPLSGYQIATRDGRSLGSTIVKAMKQKLDDVGVKPYLNTTVTKILFKDGKVAGVEAKNKNNETIEFLSPNVVIATGGFASSPERVAEYAPQWKGSASTSSVGATGDGARMGEDIGASLKYMDVVRMNPSVHVAKDGSASSLSAARAEGGIMVNWDGKRFCNDYFPNYTTLSQWILKQKKGEAWVVIDGKAMEKSKRLQGFKAKDYFVEANSIPELAKKMGVPVDNLVKTIDTYREAVKNQHDKEFGRNFNLSIDFTTPPFYAVHTKPGIQVTLGGIEVNKKFEVVRPD